MEEFLKELISDFKVASMKVHELHVNMEGILFNSYHVFLGEIYSFLEDKTDELMETMQILDLCPPISLQEQLDLTNIKEETKEVCDFEKQGPIVAKILAFLDDELQDGIIRAGQDEDYVTQTDLIEYKKQIRLFRWKNRKTFGIKEDIQKENQDEKDNDEEE